MNIQGVIINGIYRHYKGDFYKVIDVVYDCDMGIPFVVYHKCDENGIFKSIRGLDFNGREMIVGQPFIRKLDVFTSPINSSIGNVLRFKFIK